MAWFEMKLSVPDPLKDSVINRLFELGAEGVGEADAGLNVQVFFDEAQRERVTRELTVYLDSVAALFPNLPKVSLEVLPVTEEDWAQRYKQDFQPQRLTGLFYLKPAWSPQAAVPEEMIPILMEAGQAFGTGLHASTRMALRLIEWATGHHADVSSLRFLDVGTGTGILAIGAYKLGIRRIGALDIDAEAVRTAEENLLRNSCQGIRLVTGGISLWKEPVDILASNILLETHKRLAGDYRRLVKAGGQLILSGLLAYQRAEIDLVMEEQGFTIEMEEAMQEWSAVAYTFRVDHD